MRRSLIACVCLFFVVTAANAPADDVRYTTHIKPLFEKQCIGCHGPDSPEYGDFDKDPKKYAAEFKGPRMDSYAHIGQFTAWPDTGALMRRLDDGKNTKDGKPGNMYANLGSTEEERQKNLKLFKVWVGNWTLKRWPEVTKDELNGITVNY